MLRIITDNVDGVFAGIINKTNMGSVMPTSEEIGNRLFERSLGCILSCLSFSKPPMIIYDRGRLNPSRTEMFNKRMENFIYARIKKSGVFQAHDQTFHDADSIQTPGIWAADFVAGSFHRAVKYGDEQYLKSLRPKFIGGGSRMFHEDSDAL